MSPEQIAEFADAIESCMSEATALEMLFSCECEHLMAYVVRQALRELEDGCNDLPRVLYPRLLRVLTLEPAC